MGKGDKIKESKSVFLLFSQVPTFSIFSTFQVLISYTSTELLLKDLKLKINLINFMNMES